MTININNQFNEFFGVERDGTGLEAEPEPRLKPEAVNVREWAKDHGETDLRGEYDAEARLG